MTTRFLNSDSRLMWVSVVRLPSGKSKVWVASVKPYNSRVTFRTANPRVFGYILNSDCTMLKRRAVYYAKSLYAFIHKKIHSQHVII